MLPRAVPPPMERPPGDFSSPQIPRYRNLEWRPGFGSSGGSGAKGGNHSARPRGAPGGFKNLEWTPSVPAIASAKPSSLQTSAKTPSTLDLPRQQGSKLGTQSVTIHHDVRNGTSHADAAGLCKFFGSAKGCAGARCSFSHADPNSVAPCQYKQKGNCERGEACTYRHQIWESMEQAVTHYASRETGSVERSARRYKQLHRGGDAAAQESKLKAAHVEGVVERELQVETYGAAAVRMMEKMGYKAGTGLGKDHQGSTKLAKPCQALEQASQNCALGFGHFGAAASASVAERAARLAAARAQKRQKIDDATFVQHNLLSSGEESDDEQQHVQARDIDLQAAI